MDERLTEILPAAREGAEWAWEEIYRDLAPRVLGYLRARNVPDPEDLTGEVFVQVVRDLPRFKGDGRDFRAWLFTIAHHRLLDDARYRAPRRRVVLAGDEELQRRGAVGNVEQEALERLSAEGVRGILAALSDDQQAVILLRVFGDLTAPEVARVLGKRPGAVKALQHRALERLRRTLDPGGGVSF